MIKRGRKYIAKAEFSESKVVKVLKLEIKDTKRSVHFYDMQGDRRFITTTGKVFFEMFYMEG
jgi:hypothetical protein